MGPGFEPQTTHITNMEIAPIAQLDRVSDYESEG